MQVPINPEGIPRLPFCLGRWRSSISVQMCQLHDHINSADKFKNLLPREKTLLETSNSVLKNYRELMKAGGVKLDCNVTYTIFFCGMTLACKKNIHFKVCLVILCLVILCDFRQTREIRLQLQISTCIKPEFHRLDATN